MPRWLPIVALAGTAVAVGLRIYAASAIGPLWRDEAGSAATATVPSFAEFLARQPFDSFPLLWQLLARGWTDLWGTGDGAIRSFGLLVSLALLPAVWWTCRCFRVVPLATLLFAGVAPTLVVWAGVQNRGYGLGVVILAILMGAMWRLVEAPSGRRFAGTALVAVLAVQTTYHNPAMLAALIGAAAVVGLRRRDFGIVVRAIGVGAIAAASLLVYVGVLAQTRVLAKLAAVPVSVTRIASGMWEALGLGGWFVAVAFAVLFVGACAWGWTSLLRPAPRAASDETSDAVAFAAAAATFALVGQLVLLLNLQFTVQPWYYATFILIGAVSIDVVLQRASAPPRLRDAFAAAVAVLILLSSVLSARTIDRRQSNVDLIAEYLAANAAADDLIVVYPWHYGISFHRYYDGAAPFMTIPDVRGHEFHQFDQLGELMRNPELVKPGFRRIYETLTSGKRVWVVGQPLAEAPPEFPVPQSGADDSPMMRDGFYTVISGLQLAWVLNKATAKATPVPILTEKPINDLEAATLTVYALK